MERRVSRKLNSLTAILHAAACIVSVAMLLCFPAVRVHNFDAHFRTPTVRRSIERHTFVAHGENNAHERIAHSDVLPTFFTPAETVCKTVLLGDFDLVSEVPLSRLLNRLKFNPSGSGGQDPLLSA